MSQQHRRRLVVRFEGVAYEMDLDVLHVALVRRQVDGAFAGREQMADAVGCSRSTVSRYFAGRPTSLRIVLVILEKLNLTFDEVYRRCPDGEAP